MALSPLQGRIARIVADLPEASEFALAGAGGLTVWGVVDRGTRDLDYFATRPAAVALLLPALETGLERNGIAVERQRVAEGFVRLSAAAAGETCEIDLAHDARLFPTQQTDLGPVLALEELAADKVLALFGRAQPRDFLDVEALMGHFGPDRLLELAAQKDGGFDLGFFADALAAVGRFSVEDFGIDHGALHRLVERMASWRDDIIRGLEFGNRSPERAAPVTEPSLPHQPPEPPGLEL